MNYKLISFCVLKNGELERGVDALAKERSRWLDRPDLLVRAARHYEGAAQILIRQAVMTAKEVSCNPQIALKSHSHLGGFHAQVLEDRTPTPPDIKPQTK